MKDYLHHGEVVFPPRQLVKVSAELMRLGRAWFGLTTLGLPVVFQNMATQHDPVDP